jgi:hypothetical protein
LIQQPSHASSHTAEHLEDNKLFYQPKRQADQAHNQQKQALEPKHQLAGLMQGKLLAGPPVQLPSCKLQFGF